MKTLRTLLIASASLVAAVSGVHAQSAGATQSEMNRGVPGVDVDVGRNAKGAIDVHRANNETARGVPGVDVDVGRNAKGAVDVNTSNTNNNNETATQSTRPARADRG